MATQDQKPPDMEFKDVVFNAARFQDFSLEIVFNAARDGNLKRLKVFLDHLPREEVARLVSAKTNGATPLVASCMNGHQEVVEYLVDKCCASVEQPGSVTFDGETIEGAPPLWCAAAAGQCSQILSRVKMEMFSPVRSTVSSCFRSLGHSEAAGEKRCKCELNIKQKLNTIVISML